MCFENEKKFEEAVINELLNNGWTEVLEYKTEEELIQNWAEIIYNNNRNVNSLSDFRLTKSEIEQILSQIRQKSSPYDLYSFINGKTISIKRDNEKDERNSGSYVSLEIFDRQDVWNGTCNGSYTYQIVRQPRFKTTEKFAKNNRRGDFLLLINGIPLIHVELKINDTSINEGYEQIKKYSGEGVFSGLFSLMQIFVVMTPNELKYFANPGSREKFNKKFLFSWADFNNQKIKSWEKNILTFLSIPKAHQLIGYYTVADDSDKTLKVLRSYQIYAAEAIWKKVNEWSRSDKSDIKGGYIWHTTGSGKTLTSFKTAQLITYSKLADKIIFLVDRIDLSSQTFLEYSNFKNIDEDVQNSKNSRDFIQKILSNNKDRLIICSIQKVNTIIQSGIPDSKKAIINNKKIVFIVDECHRSTFGDMFDAIKRVFSKAIFFGFTGTPIQDENKKNDNTTTDVFGNELHRYSLSDGIEDHNVLGFDIRAVSTFSERDLRKEIALKEVNASSEKEALNNPNKKNNYLFYMNICPMIKNEKYEKGIEDFIPNSQYQNDTHRNAVVENICENWNALSYGRKFHGIFATSSIQEAIKYYEIFKTKKNTLNLKITSVFDEHDPKDADLAVEKEKTICTIISDYNNLYGTKFDINKYKEFKNDVLCRLAHKSRYTNIGKKPNEQLDLVIVVDQLLTGYDSKWVNTLYLDKVLEYERIIQAFSRTNRLCDDDKPFGSIKYYRKPHTMDSNIKKAVKVYSGDKEFGLYVNKLDKNLEKLNVIFADIRDLFLLDEIENFSRLPDDDESKKKFASLFNEFNYYLRSSKIQGFDWDKKTNLPIKIIFDKDAYEILLIRYKELAKEMSKSVRLIDAPYFDIDSHISETKSEINEEYLNRNFKKYVRSLSIGEKNKQLENEIHKSFSLLNPKQQNIARQILIDIEHGNLKITEDDKFTDLLKKYELKELNNLIDKLKDFFYSIDTETFKDMINKDLNSDNLNDQGKFSELTNSVDYKTTLSNLKEKYGSNFSFNLGDVHIIVNEFLKDILINHNYKLDDLLDEIVKDFKN